MGSDSDLPTMKEAAEVLESFGVKYELTVVSAHRTPERMYEYAQRAARRGVQVREDREDGRRGKGREWKGMGTERERERLTADAPTPRTPTDRPQQTKHPQQTNKHNNTPTPPPPNPPEPTPPGDHRGRRRGRAPAGDGGGADPAPRDRRARQDLRALGGRLPLLHRADAQGHPRRDRGHRCVLRFSFIHTLARSLARSLS